MSDSYALEPDLKWLDNKLRELRIQKPIWEGPILNRFQAELTLYNVASQSALQNAISESIRSQKILIEIQVEQADRLQETLERSIISQDELAKSQNKLSRRTYWVSIGEVLVGIGALALAYVTYLQIV